MGVFLPLDTLDHKGLVLELIIKISHIVLPASKHKLLFIWDVTFKSIVSTVFWVLLNLDIFDLGLLHWSSGSCWSHIGVWHHNSIMCVCHCLSIIVHNNLSINIINYIDS